MKNKYTYKEALDYCLRLLLRRDRTKLELHKKMLDKGTAKEDIAAVINQLQEWGYLDDVKYARQFISSGIHKGKGKQKLYYGMRSRGIPEEIIIQAIQEYYNEELEYEQLSIAAQKKITNLLKRTPPEDVYNKLFRFLLGRGFSKNLIKAWLKANLQAFLDNNTNKL